MTKTVLLTILCGFISIPATFAESLDGEPRGSLFMQRLEAIATPVYVHGETIISVKNEDGPIGCTPVITFLSGGDEHQIRLAAPASESDPLKYWSACRKLFKQLRAVQKKNLVIEYTLLEHSYRILDPSKSP